MLSPFFIFPVMFLPLMLPVWMAVSLFLMRTVSPTLTETRAGTNAIFCWSISAECSVCDCAGADFVGAVGGASPGSLPHATPSASARVVVATAAIRMPGTLTVMDEHPPEELHYYDW